MALSFPRAMPSAGAASQGFDLARLDYRSPTVGGRQGGVQAGPDRWRMSLTLDKMTDPEADAMRAFVDSLDGARRLFYGRDLTRPCPLAHIGAWEGGDGDASGWTAGTDGDEITLAGLDDVTLSVGDYIGFKWSSTRRALVRIVDLSGGISIRPAIPDVVPVEAVAHVGAPCCLMRLAPDETRMGEKDALHLMGGQIVAYQDLLT